MTQPHSFIRVKTQFENAGDGLINRELLRLIADNSILHADFSNCPPHFATILKGGISNTAPAWKGLGMFAQMLWLRLTGKQCYFFLMPGGYVRDDKMKMNRQYAYAAMLALLSLAGIRICHLGASYEDITPGFIKVLRLRSKILYRHLVRDPISTAYMQKHGVTVHNTMPDLAFNVFPQKLTPRKATKTPHICCSFRTDQYPEQFDVVYKFLKHTMAKAPKGVNWSFFAQVGRDAKGLTRLREMLMKDGHKINPVIDGHKDLQTCIEFYQTCDMMFSNRLHVTLLSASQGVKVLPCISGGSTEKIVGIFEDLGDADLLTHMDKPLPKGDLTTLPRQLEKAPQKRKILEQTFKELLTA